MGQFTKQKAPKAGGHQDEGQTPERSPHQDRCEEIIPWASTTGSLQLLSDAPPTRRWAGPRAGRAADWSQPSRPLTSRRCELHPPPAFSSSPSPQAPASRLPSRLPVRRSSGPEPVTPASILNPAPHHFRTFSMAAITFLMSSLARLRVSARTDRPDMAAAGAAGAGALLPRRGESRASRAATRPQQQRHRGGRPHCARVRDEARAPARPLGLEVSARLRAPPQASLPRCPRSPVGPQAGRVAQRVGGMCCGQREVRGAASGIPASFPGGLEVSSFVLWSGLPPVLWT